MKNLSKSNKTYQFKEILQVLENINFKSSFNRQQKGIVYTPLKIADFITKNIIKVYLIDILNHNFSEKYDRSMSFRELLRILKSMDLDNKKKIWEILFYIKVLDPSCGSGRFLLVVAKNLLSLFKILNPGSLEKDLKRIIINNNIFGVEIDHSALLISKLRLLEWYVRSLEIEKDNELRIETIEKQLNKISIDLSIKFNLWNHDFLLNFELKEFNIIVGNPPYVENKKLKDTNYKKKLKRFSTAFGLYDLSILFVEKSLDILNHQLGYLSFLITNKFLAADYGKKIRQKIITESQILEIIDVSSLSLFKKTATYPVIITLAKKSPDSNTLIKINDLKDENQKLNLEKMRVFKIAQNDLKNYPANVIPITSDLGLLNDICSKYENLSTIFRELIVIYRPFGFINWAKNVDLIQNESNNDKDLIVLGTGNVGKFHIKFEKGIRIAKQQLKLAYFPYNPKFSQIWPKLASEKLLVREIATKLTAVYDPGLYTNLTGLYSIIIPSFSTNQYFSLLTILNSKTMNKIFNGLYGTLHMAGGYLRYNGSFLKRLPLPSSIPNSLGDMGKIMQFLSQMQYELQINHNLNYEVNNISNLKDFFKRLSNCLVDSIYFDSLKNVKINKMLNSEHFFPKIEFKYFLPRFNSIKYQFYKLDELKNTFNKIYDFYKVCTNDENLLLEIQNFTHPFNNTN
jgi:hypothetical protein